MTVINNGQDQFIKLYEKRREDELRLLGKVCLTPKCFACPVGQTGSVTVDIPPSQQIRFDCVSTNIATMEDVSQMLTLATSESIRQEKLMHSESTIKDIVLKMLPLLDSIEYGIKAYKNDISDVHCQGLIQMRKEGLRSLSDLGVFQIEAENKPFDPCYHYAVFHITDMDLPESTVKEVLLSGYFYKGEVIRYASVVVAN